MKRKKPVIRAELNMGDSHALRQIQLPRMKSVGLKKLHGVGACPLAGLAFIVKHYFVMTPDYYAIRAEIIDAAAVKGKVLIDGAVSQKAGQFGRPAIR